MKYRVSWVENEIGCSKTFDDYNKACAFAGEKEETSEFDVDLKEVDE